MAGCQFLYFIQRDLVVPIDHDLLTQLPEILHQVVGERVVIVDHQEHVWATRAPKGLEFKNIAPVILVKAGDFPKRQDQWQKTLASSAINAQTPLLERGVVEFL